MEIEQKYLIKSLPHNIDDYEHRDIVQGYISFEPVLRIRKVYENFIFTFKVSSGRYLFMYQKNLNIINQDNKR